MTVRAVDRAIDVLMCLSDDKAELGVAEIQAKLKLSRATLYRLLATLQRRGLVYAGGEPQRYRLDFGVMKLADALLTRLDVSTVAEPELSRLWHDTDETVALYVPASDRVRVLVRELRSRQPLSFSRGI